jgi:DNA-binding beta-propeller fold protein YncE
MVTAVIWQKRSRWLTLFVVSCLLGACAAPEKLRGELRYGMETSSEGKQIHFPPPPEPPRFAYAGELIGARNFFYDRPKQNFGQKLLALLTGVSDRDRELELTRPQAVVADSVGRVYVSDAGLAAVFLFDPVDGEARLLKSASGFRNFISPSGVAIGPGDTVFVADAEAGFVARIDSTGKTYPSIGEGVLKRPTGVVFDPSQQRLFVADTAASDLKVFDLEGRLLMVIGKLGSALGEFNRPSYMAIWRNELYVTDTFNARIQVLDLDSGAPIRSIGTRGTYVGQLSMPKGVALDSDGNVYVVESLHDHLLIFNRQGQFLLPIGGTGYSSGKFYLPAGLWIDARNRIYVADMFNGRVVTYLYLGGEAESDD